jgi:hypothetical protein
MALLHRHATERRHWLRWVDLQRNLRSIFSLSVILL